MHFNVTRPGHKGRAPWKIRLKNTFLKVPYSDQILGRRRSARYADKTSARRLFGRFNLDSMPKRRKQVIH